MTITDATRNAILQFPAHTRRLMGAQIRIATGFDFPRYDPADARSIRSVTRDFHGFIRRIQLQSGETPSMDIAIIRVIAQRRAIFA